MNNTVSNFNTNKSFLDDYIGFGEVPPYMKDKLTDFIKKQENKVIKIKNSIKTMSSNHILATRITLPIEFIFVKNELKYIKIANDNFLNRLVLKQDTSESKHYEQYIYTKDGMIDIMPLLPINDVDKFELDVPICISIIENCNAKIETPINYKDLF